MAADNSLDARLDYAKRVVEEEWPEWMRDSSRRYESELTNRSAKASNPNSNAREPAVLQR